MHISLSLFVFPLNGRDRISRLSFFFPSNIINNKKMQSIGIQKNNYLLFFIFFSIGFHACFPFSDPNHVICAIFFFRSLAIGKSFVLCFLLLVGLFVCLLLLYVSLISKYEVITAATSSLLPISRYCLSGHQRNRERCLSELVDENIASLRV